MRDKPSRRRAGHPILFLISGLFIVPSAPGTAQDSLRSKQEKAAGFILFEIEKNFGASSPDVLKKLGPPEEVSEKKTENIHVPGVEETVFRLHYPGVTFVYLKENDLHKEFLVEAELTGAEFALSWGVRIGISRERLTEIFGEPNERLENLSVHRYTDSEGLNWVDFSFDGDSLSKIHWVFYLD